MYYPSCFANTTRGICGGEAPTKTKDIEFFTLTTTGTSQDFGNLTENTGGAGCSNNVRGLFGGGYNPGICNVITYTTIASLGDTIDFGDLITSRRGLGACASPSRGLFSGGANPANRNEIEFVNIASTGNASDFGDLLASLKNKASCSDSHGGIG